MKGKYIIGSLAKVMRGRNVSMEVKRFKEQYPPANIDMDMKREHGIGHSSQECVLWKLII